MSEQSEVRVEFAHDLWKSKRVEIEEWLNAHAMEWRCFSTHYWDGELMSHAQVEEQRITATQEHLSKASKEREAFLLSVSSSGEDWSDDDYTRAQKVLAKNEIERRLLEKRKTRRFWVAFEKPGDAVLFKLRWGGVA